MDSSNILNYIQSIILKSPDTSDKYYTFINQNINLLLSDTISPQLNLYLLISLQNNIIHPDSLLTTSLKYITDFNSIIPIGLALRFKANPNIYIDNHHILIHLYHSEINISLLTIIFYMLLISGSNILLPVDNNTNISIIQYFKEHHIPQPLFQLINNDNVEPIITTTTSILLDNVNIGNPDIKNYPLIVLAHSNYFL